MITQPSCERLLEVVRQELAATIAPAVADPGLQAVLGMIDATVTVLDAEILVNDARLVIDSKPI